MVGRHGTVRHRPGGHPAPAEGRVPEPVGSADRPIRPPGGGPYDAVVSDRPAAGSAAPVVSEAPTLLLGPTSLDRLLARVQQAAPALTRASSVGLVAVTASLAAADVVVWATDRVVDDGRSPVPLGFLPPLLGVLATIAVAARPRHEVGALTALATASVALTVAGALLGASLPPSLAALFALAVLTAGVLRRAPGSVAAPLTGLAAVAVAAEAVRPFVGSAGYLLLVCEGAFVVAVGVGVYLRWTDWRRAVTAETARIEERLEIARELHDLVGHHLSAMVVQAQAARHVAEHRPAASAVALERIEQTGTEALTAMRRMVGGLRDHSTSTPQASWDDLDRLLADAVARGEPVDARVDPEVRTLPNSLAPSVHRILTESLTNVRRHGQAVHVIDVSVRRRDDRLELTVQDDGAPAADGPAGFGIVGMRERAAALGGSLSAGPGMDGGWVVRAELPLDPPG